MKIKIDPANGLFKVIDPSCPAEIYLSAEVITRLEIEERLSKLDEMRFCVNLSGQEWEISDEPPVGTPGTLASIIFYIQGTFYREDGKIMCTIS